MKKITYEEFSNKVMEAIRELAPHKDIYVEMLLRNNGVEKEGIKLIDKGENVNEQITPFIFLDQFYNKFLSDDEIKDIAENIINVAEAGEKRTIFDIDLDPGRFVYYLKENVVYALVNYEKNKEYIEELIYKRWYDLAIIYYINYEEMGVNAQSKVTKEILTFFKDHEENEEMIKDMIHSFAEVNTPKLYPVKITGLQESLKELVIDEMAVYRNELYLMRLKTEMNITPEILEHILDEFEYIGGDDPRYDKYKDDALFVSNYKKTFGASVIFYDGVLKKMAKNLGGSFAFIFLSVHEVLILNGHPAFEEIYDYIKGYNVLKNKQDEVLSDSVYFYDHIRDEITIVIED